MSNSGKVRCQWPGDDPLYIKYHDDEWGTPSHHDQHLFEMLILEGMQAGLSWITILRKRENFRRAFDHFDVQKVAGYDEAKIAELLNDPGIIRNRLKINAAIKNAQGFIKIQEVFGSFDRYLWDFVDGKPIQNQFKALSELPGLTPLSEKISKDLKKRGFAFVGPTGIYAYMQSVGIVNDHVIGCFRHAEVQK